MKQHYKVAFCLLLCGFFFQVKAQSKSDQIEKVLSILSDQFSEKPFSTQIDYYQKNRGEDTFKLVSTCTMIQREDWQRIIFDDEETLISSLAYLKVDKKEQKFYYLKSTVSQKELEKRAPVAIVTNAQLELYRLSLDTVRSSLSKGKIYFTPLAGSNYEELFFQYNPKTLQPMEYTVQFTPSAFPEVQTIKTLFKNFRTVGVDFDELLSPKNYLHEKRGQVQLNEEYSNYELIQHF